MHFMFLNITATIMHEITATDSDSSSS